MSVVDIFTGAEFDAIRSALTSTYEQQNNIDLSVLGNFTAMYTDTIGTGFSGTYDGQFFSLENLSSAHPSSGTANFYKPEVFGSQFIGVVRSVRFVNILLDGVYPSLATGNNSTRFLFQDVLVQGKVSTNNVNGSGAAFSAQKSFGTFRRCISEVDLDGIATFGLGGVSGDSVNGPIIEDCIYRNAHIDSSAANREQIVGSAAGAAGSILRCVAHGTGANAGPTGSASVSAVFWDEDVAVGQSGGIGTALSTADMQDITTYVNAGFDIGAI